MNVILQCPVDAPAVPALGNQRPLVLVPFLGQTVLEHALAGLAAEGVKRVRLEGADPVEEIRQVVGQGEAWGIKIVFAQDAPPSGEWSDARVVTLNALPQLPQQPLWGSYRDWYGAQLALLPVVAAQRVGMREVAPGVFVGHRAQLAGDATLTGPCWIGANVFIGPKATVGPGSIIEDGSYIDGGAEIVGSVVGPQTYVGAFTELRDSFAWGSRLLHLGTGSATEVTDCFLLGPVQSESKLVDGLRSAVRFLGRQLPFKSSTPASRPTPGTPSPS